MGIIGCVYLFEKVLLLFSRFSNNSTYIVIIAHPAVVTNDVSPSTKKVGHFTSARLHNAIATNMSGKYNNHTLC